MTFRFNPVKLTSGGHFRWTTTEHRYLELPMPLRKSVLPPSSFTPKVPPQEPVWRGPTTDGVTQTMLGRYLTCPERFRVSYVEGLQPNPTFNARLEFGNLWHAAEEALAGTGAEDSKMVAPHHAEWKPAVNKYANELAERFPLQQPQIVHWLKVCHLLFPVYIDHWRKHPDMLARTPVMSEEKFRVRYQLPSGRSVILRGKWDSVDLVDNEPKGKGVLAKVGKREERQSVWLQENKTKSSIDVLKINRQLKFDLQTMLYLIALVEEQARLDDSSVKNALSYSDPPHRCFYPIRGIRYNVIKRGTHKTAENMHKACTEALSAGQSDEWFARWNVVVDKPDIDNFKHWTLNPVLENLLDDYEWWSYCYTYRKDTTRTSPFTYRHRETEFPKHMHRHYVMPFIGYNPLTEGGETDLDNYLFTGSEVGLRRITHTDLFPELT